MTPSSWLEFNCELYDVIAELEVDIDRVESGRVVLETDRSIPLLALAQHCHLRAREDWSDLIAHHLVHKLQKFADAGAAGDEEFSMIDLRVRLVPENPADAGVYEMLGARPYTEGVVQMLVADVPTAIRPVPMTEIEELGWDPDAAWVSAWAQTAMLERPDEINVIDLGGAEMLHVFGERPLVASLVEAIPEIIGPLGEHGGIVAIPHGYSVLIHSIEPDTLRVAVNAMIPIARQLNRQGPSAVSPHLYWWYDGRLTWMPTYFAPDGVEAYPPPGLVESLRGCH